MTNDLCRSTLASGHISFPRATVMSLPPELLIMIFEYIYFPLRLVRDGIRDPFTSSRDIQDINERMTRGKVFPYPYVDVCRHWSEVILSVPRFWTNTVLFIGPVKVYGNFIAGPEAILKASKKLPVDITIRSTKLDSKFDPTYRDGYVLDEELQDELASIVRILKLLGPHLHRCRSLSLFTLIMGAAPIIYNLLQGDAPLLSMLSIHTDSILFTEDDGLNTLPLERTLAPSPFAPQLEQLIIDGYSFLAIHKYHDKIRAQYGASLASLAIVNYCLGQATHPDLLTASMTITALQEMEQLHALKLAHVIFDPDPAVTQPATEELGIRALVLEDMSNEALAELFRVASFPVLEDVWFKACWPAGHEYEPDALPIDCPLLTIESISADCYDISPVLKHLNVNILRASASSAFNDSVLDMIASPLDPETPEAGVNANTEFCCDSLRAMSIIACPDVSIAALKRLVEKRNRWVDYDDPQWRTNVPIGPAIMEISLWELPNLMMFGKEDEEWFRARVATFRIESMLNEYLKHEDIELYSNANI